MGIIKFSLDQKNFNCQISKVFANSEEHFGFFVRVSIRLVKFLFQSKEDLCGALFENK